MSKIIKTIEELIATDLKHDGYWLVFNTRYNDVAAFKKPLPEDPIGFWLNPTYTDEHPRQEFVEFMSSNFPKVRTVEVLDFVSVGTLQWPYLGSIAVDIQKGDDVYQALSAKYGNPEENATDHRHVFWMMDYETAVKLHTEREAFWEEELSDDDSTFY